MAKLCRKLKWLVFFWDTVYKCFCWCCMNIWNFGLNQLVSHYTIWSKNQSNCSVFSNIYLKIIYTRKGLCLGKKMWLSAALLLTMVLTLDSSWSLYIGPALWPTTSKNTTACLQHKPQTGWHKTVRKLLDNYLLIVTFYNGENYSIQFKISINGPTFDSIRNEKNCLCSNNFWPVYLSIFLFCVCISTYVCLFPPVLLVFSTWFYCSNCAGCWHTLDIEYMDQLIGDFFFSSFYSRQSWLAYKVLLLQCD